MAFMRRQHARISCSVAQIAVALAALSSGCAEYMPVGKSYRDSSVPIQVNLPKGWLQYTPANPIYLMTRDGLQLETISLSVTKMGKKLKDTDRVYGAGMLPQEIADLSLGLIAASDEIKDLKINRIELAQVAGQDGYKAEADYIDKTGLRKRLCLYGVAIHNYICELRYDAAQEVYFDKYRDTFDRLVAAARSP